jgi:hypothetical protein
MSLARTGKGPGEAGPSAEGEVLLSIEVLPAALANGSLLNGHGRADPNAHPELPPPLGRFDPTKAFDPFCQ